MEIVSLLPLVAIALVFWLLLVRPAARRQKEVARLQAGLKPGDRVVLSSGMFATLREVRDDRVTAEIADGVVVEVARGAVAGVDLGTADAPADPSDPSDPTDPTTPDSPSSPGA